MRTALRHFSACSHSRRNWCGVMIGCASSSRPTSVGTRTTRRPSSASCSTRTSGTWKAGIIADRPATTFDKDPVRDHLGLAAKDGYEFALAYLMAYGVFPNLSRHAKGYPTLDELRMRTVPGHNDTDAGVRLLTAAADRDDPRPIWYGNWGSNSGSKSNLRRALDKAKADRTPGRVREVRGEVPHRHPRRPRPEHASGAR